MVVSPVLAVTLAAAAAAALAKVVVNEWHRVNTALHPRQTVPVKDNDVRQALPTLRRDPHTGIYRPD
jgi:hypothetical protein